VQEKHREGQRQLLMHQITTVFHQPKKIMLFGTNFPEQRKLVVAAAIYSNFNSNLLVQRDA